LHVNHNVRPDLSYAIIVFDASNISYPGPQPKSVTQRYYGGSEDYFTHKNSGIDFHLDVGTNCGKGCSQSLLSLRGNYSAPLYADRALDILKDHDPSIPLFLYSPFQSVHCPIEAPASYVQPYLHLAPQRQVFAGMLAALDEAVGRVYKGFTDKGMTDNLLTIFTTDNGGPVL